MNVLFIMSDQLRWDHLGVCRPPVPADTAHRRAGRGAACDSRNAYVSSGVCGPSRMSYYTGRYPHQPRRDVEPRAAVGGRDDPRRIPACCRRRAGPLALAGKTHVMPDHRRPQARLADRRRQGELGHLLERGGFREVERYDGHHDDRPEASRATRQFLQRPGLRRATIAVERATSSPAIDERGSDRQERLAHAQRAPAGAGGASRTPRPPT